VVPTDGPKVSREESPTTTTHREDPRGPDTSEPMIPECSPTMSDSTGDRGMTSVVGKRPPWP
jgi:hypothetical protein